MEYIDEAKQSIEKARGIFVLSGAGISAESGVPTFRNPGGLWNQIDPMKVATPEAFEANPEYVWRWYDERRTQLASKRPNPGHDALVRLERSKENFFILTQNVDDLHEQAGTVNLAHIHGEIWKVRCTSCGNVREDRSAPLRECPPTCPACHGMERPHVVWFGEMIDVEAIEKTEAFLESGKVDVVMVIGTEATFPYIINWVIQAKNQKATFIEINMGRTEISSLADIRLQGKSGEILPLICV
jgi:NAD-dependent deacetylase